MAECSRTEPSADGHDSGDVNISGWTNGLDSDSHQRRSNVIDTIMDQKNLNQLRIIVESGWDVNEELHMNWRDMPALHHAALKGWSDGVKILFAAGAKTTASDEIENLLALVLENPTCSIDLLKLLLEHGVDPNEHDDEWGNIPLLKAIENYRSSGNAKSIVQLLLENGANPNVEYQVDIGGCGPTKLTPCTALHDAASHGWTEGVQMLFDAGAKYKRSAGLNPLAQALHNYDCPADLIKLLLRHGADPNDHNGEYENIPLVAAIAYLDQNDTNIIELLLGHGAHPDVMYWVYNGGICEQHTLLHEAGRSVWTKVVEMFLDANYVTSAILEETLTLALGHYECPSDLIELLLKQGVDLNHSVIEDGPLLHRLFKGTALYSQHPLDMFFLHGGNINIENGDNLTVLEWIVKHAKADRASWDSDSIRWLIRHGSHASRMRFSWLKRYFMPFSDPSCHFLHIAIILLQAGMMFLHGAQAQLSHMQVAISTWLEDDTTDDKNIITTIKGMWDELEEADEEEPQRVQHNVKKSTFPEYWNRQMIDLQEFSDKSLYDYGYTPCRFNRWSTRQMYQNMLEQTQRVLGFLTQPQSLQWYCRRSVRENLVSLQPSVVKTLPIPARLKRYILCHEI